MARDVYSENFVSGILTDTEAAATVPAGITWVVRQISFGAVSGLAGDQAFVRVGGIVYIAEVDLPLSLALPPSVTSHEGRWVIPAGGQLEWGAVTGTWTFHISGYALTLP